MNEDDGGVIDLNKLDNDSIEAIRKLKHANEVAGGIRVGSQEAIDVLEKVPCLIRIIGKQRRKLE